MNFDAFFTLTFNNEETFVSTEINIKRKVSIKTAFGYMDIKMNTYPPYSHTSDIYLYVIDGNYPTMDVVASWPAIPNAVTGCDGATVVEVSGSVVGTYTQYASATLDASNYTVVQGPPSGFKVLESLTVNVYTFSIMYNKQSY